MSRTKIALIALMGFSLSACSTQQPPEPSEDVVQQVIEREVVEVTKDVPAEPVPGTVNGVWVEPMNDFIRVPAGLDPKNTYYRPSHRTIVEIRQGRFQQVEFPQDK